MTTQPIQGSGGPNRAATAPDETTGVTLTSSEQGPVSVLDLLNHAISDKDRTSNAAALITASASGVSRVIVSLGLVLIVAGSTAGALIHFAGFGPALGSALAVGGTAGVAGVRYLRNRRATRRQSGRARRT